MFRRIVIAIILIGVLSGSTLSQDTCARRYSPYLWSLSGFSGDINTGPGGSPTWQQALAQQVGRYGGAPSCTHTFYFDNPAGHWGHYYGECHVYATGCNPPPVANCSNCESPAAGSPINLTTG